MKGSRTLKAGKVDINAISPEAKDLLETILADWENFKEQVPQFEFNDEVYAFAYWLCRWSGLVQPANADTSIPLRDLRPGAIFATLDRGILAVKSEYHYSAPSGSSKETQCECILLESGEYAHFAKGNDTLVKEIMLPTPSQLKGTPRPDPITTGIIQSADTIIRWDSVLIALTVVLVLLGAAGILLYLWA